MQKETHSLYFKHINWIIIKFCWLLALPHSQMYPMLAHNFSTHQFNVSLLKMVSGHLKQQCHPTFTSYGIILIDNLLCFSEDWGGPYIRIYNFYSHRKCWEVKIFFWGKKTGLEPNKIPAKYKKNLPNSLQGNKFWHFSWNALISATINML